MKTRRSVSLSHLAACAALLLAVGARGEAPAAAAPPAALLMMPPPPPPPGIQVFDNSVFDGVGRPSKLEQTMGSGEYSSTDYQAWLRACDSKKDVSMQAYRECVDGLRSKSGAALQERRQRVEQRSLQMRPPSPLDEPMRTPSENSESEDE